MFHPNFKRSGIFQVYFILNSRMMWISKTISLSTDIQQIMASTCNQNPNLHIFFHGAKLLKGQRSFWPPGKRRGWFFFHQKLEQLQKTPNLNSLVEADLWKNISSQKLFEAQNNHFLNTKKRWILFGKAPKKIKKRDLFCFSFSAPANVAQRYGGLQHSIWSHINKPFGMSFLTRGSCMFCYFSTMISKIGIWDILTI